VTAEVDVAYTWIEATLAGDTTLASYAPGGVYQSFALPGTATPYCLVEYQPGGSSNHPVFGGANAYSKLMFRVVATGPIAAASAIASAAARIATLLTVASPVTVTGGTISGSFASTSVSKNEWVDGAKWLLDGAEWTIFVKAS